MVRGVAIYILKKHWKFITLAGKSQILWFFQNHSRLAWALIWNSYRMLSGILPWWTGEPFFNFHRARYGKGVAIYILKKHWKIITLAGKSQILWFFQNHSRLAWALIWNSHRMLSGILPWWTGEPFFNFHRARYGKGGGHIYTEKALKNYNFGREVANPLIFSESLSLGMGFNLKFLPDAFRHPTLVNRRAIF